MQELWDAGRPARLLATTAGYRQAAAALDAECRLRHAQAAANGEGTTGMRHRLEIHDEQGPAVLVVYSPDTSAPYDSLMGALDEEVTL